MSDFENEASLKGSIKNGVSFLSSHVLFFKVLLLVVETH